MSEDFDREAEKKRLREKLETEDDRQTTEHMSELLLKGATMTNRHCDACGDPIFRYDGQEFCPTCQEAVRDAGGGQDPESQAGDASRQPPADADTQPSRDDSSGDDAGSEERSPATAATDASGGRDAGSQTAPVDSGTVPERETRTEEIQVDATGDLGEARASLARTLTRLATQAENATDVRRTRDLLAAAREAAEAIAALDRTGR